MSDPITESELMRELQILLHEGEEEALEIFLRLIRPEDIADWLDRLSFADRRRIVSVLSHEAAGTVLADTTPSIRARLVEEIHDERLARIAEAMPPDEAADLIGEMEDEQTEQVLSHISEEDEEVLRDLLRYPEDTAGGIMNPEIVALAGSATVDDAIGLLRTADSDTVTAAVYVIDEHHRLLGYVRLRRLVTAQPASRLDAIMQSNVISVPVDADQEKVADVVDKYGFMAIPVVDADGRLLGSVTIDDVIEVIEEEATEDIYKMAGSSASEEDSQSIFHVARYRLPWLLICLAGTQMSTAVMQLFARQVPVYEQMSIFIPAIMAMGGNTSLQSATTTVRRLALDTLPRSRYPMHVLREFLVALVVGVFCGLCAAGLAVLFRHPPEIGLAVGTAMALAMSAASLFGGAMPLILDLLHIDPAVASGPLVSTVNDSLSLVIYFTVATALLIAFA